MKRVSVWITLLILLAMISAPVGAAPPDEKEVRFYLTILHNNDGESDLVDLGTPHSRTSAA